MDCIFCKIINKEIPAQIIYEDDNYLAFLDIKPNTKGHSLLIPKKHSLDFSALSDTEAGALAVTAHKIAPLLVRILGTEAYNLGLNNGSSAGQIIGHVHMHIIPRYSDDGLVHWQDSQKEAGLLEETFSLLKGKIK